MRRTQNLYAEMCSPKYIRSSCTHTSHTHLCAQLAELPREYDEYLYQRIIKYYGTHIIIFVQYGGKVTLTSQGQACLLKSGTPISRSSPAQARARQSLHNHPEFACIGTHMCAYVRVCAHVRKI